MKIHKRVKLASRSAKSMEQKGTVGKKLDETETEVSRGNTDEIPLKKRRPGN
jgi:hypothetical protein